MASIGILGYGVVGSALGEALKRKHSIFAFDINKALCNRNDVYDKCKYIFFCVPTPELPSGGLDLKIMNEAIAHAENYCTDKIFVIKSTLPVGTTERYQKNAKNRYIFNPEFLVEVDAIKCTQKPELLIAGSESIELTKSLANDVYKPLGQRLEVLQSARQAEFTKLYSNWLLASFVTAANEAFKISILNKIDFEEATRCLLKLKVMPRNIAVPGPDGKCGFGGKCLPKDISEACAMFRRAGFTSYFFEEVIRSNWINRQMPVVRIKK